MMGCAKSRQWIEEDRLNQSGSDRRSDAEIMRCLAGGETAALGELYLKYGTMVAYAALTAAPSLSRCDVEDICQDVFIVVAKSAKKYREAGKLKSWLYSIAVRTARKRRRAQRIRDGLLFAVRGRPVGVSGHRPMPEETAMSRMDLYRAFQGLTETQRQALVLFEIEGMSGEEVSEMLGIRLNTVWSHLRRARNRILDVFGGCEGAKEGRK